MKRKIRGHIYVQAIPQLRGYAPADAPIDSEGASRNGDVELLTTTWRQLRDAVKHHGGREQRDPDGALAVYPPQGQRLFEVYDRE